MSSGDAMCFENVACRSAIKPSMCFFLVTFWLQIIPGENHDRIVRRNDNNLC